MKAPSNQTVKLFTLIDRALNNTLPNNCIDLILHLSIDKPPLIISTQYVDTSNTAEVECTEYIVVKKED